MAEKKPQFNLEQEIARAEYEGMDGRNHIPSPQTLTIKQPDTVLFEHGNVIIATTNESDELLKAYDDGDTHAH